MIKNSYTSLLYLTYLFYFLIFFGLWSETIYLTIILDSIRIFISLFLIFRFNPLYKGSFNELDKKIAFHAGLLLLSLTTVTALLKNIPIVNDDIQQRIDLLSSARTSSS